MNDIEASCRLDEIRLSQRDYTLSLIRQACRQGKGLCGRRGTWGDEGRQGEGAAPETAMLCRLPGSLLGGCLALGLLPGWSEPEKSPL